MSAAILPRAASEARALWALALLALPVSLTLAIGLAFGLMGWIGCRYLSPTAGGLGASSVVVLAGALASSFVLTLTRARKAIGQAAKITSDVEDPDRLADVARLARAVGVPAPALRVVPIGVPVAFGVHGSVPAVVVSTWVFERLDRDEWCAVLAHELAHLRRGDRFLRWTGSWLLGAARLVPGTAKAWRRLEAASEVVADEVAIATLGDATALASARAKFGGGGSHAAGPMAFAMAWSPPSWSHRLAALGLGSVLSLPMVPFVLVPLCAMACAR